MSRDGMIVVLLGLGTLGLAACNDLPAVDSSVCGNGVVEPAHHERCDTFAPAGQECWAPGTPHECLYKCATSLSTPLPHCPEAYGCGIDGVCRREASLAIGDAASEPEEAEFVAWGSLLSISAQIMKLGDFDGDGIKDLLALDNPGSLRQAHPTIVFFDSTSSSHKVFDPRLPISSPAITALNTTGDPNDRREQVVYSTYVGIGTLAGTADRSVPPIVYPFQVLPPGMSYRILPIRGTNTTPLREGVLIFWNSPDEYRLFPADWPEAMGMLPASMANLTGEPVAANVVGGDDSCEESILTFHGDGQAYIINVCDERGRWRIPADPRTPVDLKPIVRVPNHTIERPALPARINDDPYVDLVLTDERGLPHVAFGMGDGTFAANPTDPAATLGIAWPVAMSAGDCAPDFVPRVQSPLAIANLNADTIPDWVLPNGVKWVHRVEADPQLGQILVTVCPANEPFGTDWSVARIGDLNGDGRPDVLAGSSVRPDLDLLRGTERDRLNPLTIRTEGPVIDMAVGDFDGDLLQDVAFVDSTYGADSSVPSSERLAIAFGARDLVNLLAPPVRMGNFDHIVQVKAGCYEGDDAIDELGVVEQRADGQSSLTIFVGNSVRLPVAPLGLANLGEEEGDSDKPLASAVGRFDSSGQPGVIAVSYKKRFWLLPQNPNGDFGIPWPSRPLPPGIVLLDANQELSFFLVTGDVDRDREHKDEAYLLAAGTEESTFGWWHIDLPEDRTTWIREEPATLLSVGSGKLLATSDPMLQDVDGDGAPDLVLIRSTSTAEAELVVVWNDNGQIQLEAATTVPLDNKAARGFAVARNRGNQRFVATTDDATYRVRVGADRTLTTTPIAGVGGGHAVAMGDVTGDGLLDLVLAVPEGIRVFATKTEIP